MVAARQAPLPDSLVVRRPVLVYVVGPCTSGATLTSPEAVRENVDTAILVSAALARLGYVPVLSHPLALVPEAHRFPGGVWKLFGAQALERCDAIALIRGWQGSKGSVEEVDALTRSGRGGAIIQTPAGGNEWSREAALELVGWGIEDGDEEPAPLTERAPLPSAVA